MPLRKHVLNSRDTILEKQSEKNIIRNNIGLANIKLLRKLSGPRISAQAPGQLVNSNIRPLIGYGRRKRQRGGRALGLTQTDKYGAYMYYPNLINN